MAYWEQALTIFFLALHLIWWPISRLFASLAFLLAPFYRVAFFLLLPLIHAAHVLVNILSIPFSLAWLQRIEVRMLCTACQPFSPFTHGLQAKRYRTDTIHLSWHSGPHRLHHRRPPLHHRSIAVICSQPPSISRTQASPKDPYRGRVSGGQGYQKGRKFSSCTYHPPWHHEEGARVPQAQGPPFFRHHRGGGLGLLKASIQRS